MTPERYGAIQEDLREVIETVEAQTGRPVTEVERAEILEGLIETYEGEDRLKAWITEVRHHAECTCPECTESREAYPLCPTCETCCVWACECEQCLGDEPEVEPPA